MVKSTDDPELEGSTRDSSATGPMKRIPKKRRRYYYDTNSNYETAATTAQQPETLPDADADVDTIRVRD